MDIEPIETHYAGCRFRSRLEARWAVAFDAAGWDWEYEPEGFAFNGHRYLPDFRITNGPEGLGGTTYIEVKGSDNDAKWGVWQDFVEASRHDLMILGPIPNGPTFHPVILDYTYHNTKTWEVAFAAISPNRVYWEWAYSLKQYDIAEYDPCIGLDNHAWRDYDIVPPPVAGIKLDPDDWDNMPEIERRYKTMYNAARSARFGEHNR